MDTTYRTGEKRRQNTGRRETGGRRRKEQESLSAREKRRLAQLCTCIVLFFVVFIGKGVFPDKMVAMQERANQILHADTDFKAVFASLGKSISEGEPVLDTMQSLWVDVFGSVGVTVEETIVAPTQPSALCLTHVDWLTTGNKTALWGSVLGLPEQAEQEEIPPEPEPEPVAEEPVAEETAEVIYVAYDGPALPDNATMDQYRLGLAATVTPVFGVISSDYGWRMHPVDEEEKFHSGVDIAAATGTAIKAFAAGTVDFIGESPIYGLYLQIDHGNGVTTFYCHCSKLCVQQGQTVAAGDPIAEVGETGNATGPHLHFEIKRSGLLLNPNYYIDE